MQLTMQTQYSKLTFELHPEEIGKLVQSAFRYASGMAKIQPGWSQGTIYQEGTEDPAGEEAREEYGEEPPEKETLYGPTEQEDWAENPLGIEKPEGWSGNFQEGLAEADSAAIGNGTPSEWVSQEAQAWGQPSESSAEGSGTMQHLGYPRIRQEDRPKKYKGFLMIRCQHCGKLKCFCAKTPIHTYTCDCGGRTLLGELRSANAECKCGEIWRYMTNVSDETIDINCLHCGSPIDMVLNCRKNVYVTLQDRM